VRKAGNIAIASASATAIIVIAAIAYRVLTKAESAPPAPVPASTAVSAAPATLNPVDEMPPAVGVSPGPGDAGAPRDLPAASEYRGVAAPAASSAPGDALNQWQHAFAQEVRNEDWARPLEVSIQQSIAPEIDLGHFYVSNIECRATLCEIRLLAYGSLQRAELERFGYQIGELPWALGLNAALATGSASPDRYEAIWIFEKNPEPAPGN